MFRALIAAVAMSLATTGAAVAKPPPEVIRTAAQSILRVIARDCPNGRVRQGTGFVWPDAGRAVTALHVVADCGKVDVQYIRQGVTRGARVARVLRRADLAMLEIENPAEARPFVDAGPPEEQAEVAAVGAPADLSDVHEFYGVIKVGFDALEKMLKPTARQSLVRLGAPDIGLRVFRIDAVLRPGTSGGPVIDAEGRVVGVIDGGLDGGNVAINWAVPAAHLEELRVSDEANAMVGLGPEADVAFAFSVGGAATAATAPDAAGGPAPGAGARLACGGREFFLLGERSLDDIAGSVTRAGALDDPQGFINLTTALAQHMPLQRLAELRFKLYVDETSGATIATPADMPVQDGGGFCYAEAEETDIGLAFRNQEYDGALPTADYLSSAFEMDILGALDVIGCQADPNWTEIAPHRRAEDGMIARRGGSWCQDSEFAPSFVGFAHMTRGQSYTGLLAVNTDPESVQYDPVAVRDWAAVALSLVISTYQF